jgi:hypothetical protein
MNAAAKTSPTMTAPRGNHEGLTLPAVRPLPAMNIHASSFVVRRSSFIV